MHPLVLLSQIGMERLSIPSLNIEMEEVHPFLIPEKFIGTGVFFLPTKKNLKIKYEYNCLTDKEAKHIHIPNGEYGVFVRGKKVFTLVVGVDESRMLPTTQ